MECLPFQSGCEGLAKLNGPDGRNQPTTPIETAEFRRILGHWVTGVAVVAARRADGQPCGLTVNAFTSLSLGPPLVLVCIERSADSHDCIRDAGAFSVNVLAAADRALARRFATSGGSKFDGLDLGRGSSGAPILKRALAWVDCRLHAQHAGGDHSIFVGEVLDGGVSDGDPLVFHRGDYEGLHP